MDERTTSPETSQEQIPKFRGLYRHVKISVKALDRIIVACIAVILIVVVFELMNPGLAITFHSKGGTDVPGISQEYGELLDQLLALAMEALASGDQNEGSRLYEQMRHYICRTEPDFQFWLDVYRILEVTQKYTGFHIN